MALNIEFYAYAIIGHTRADQLLPQLLMEQFDTFPIQCSYFIQFNSFTAKVDCSHLHFYTPANFVCGGYTVFTLSVRPCIRP